MNENFIEKPLLAKGFPLGLITDGDIKDKPFESVQGGYNIDYFGDKTKRRDALEYIQKNLTLPSGYVIAKIQEKNFIDANGSTVTAYIVFATKTGYPPRIFVTKWYNPAFTSSGKYYQNAGGGTTGWTDVFTELTEQYSVTTDTDEYQIGKDLFTINLQSTNDDLVSKADDYFRGFFVYWNILSTPRYLGIVTGSYQRDNGKHVICIRTSMKPVSGDSDLGNEIYESDLPISGILLVRYPIVKDIQSGTIDDISVVDLPNNALAVSFGADYEPLWIGLLSDKHLLSKTLGVMPASSTGNISSIELISASLLRITLSSPMGSDPELAFVQLDGITGDYSILNGNIYQVHTNTPSVLDCYWAGSSAGLITPSSDGTATFVSNKLTYGNYWDGYWLTRLTPNVSNIDKWFVSYADVFIRYKEDAEDCGIILCTRCDNSTGLIEHKNRMAAICIEYDHINTIFLKMVAARISTSVTIDVSFQVILKSNFDRRITAFKTFYRCSDSENYVPESIDEGDSAEIECVRSDYLPYQVIKEEGGDISVEEIDGNLTYFSVATPFYQNKEKSNTGSNLNNFLGHYYYNAPYLKCKGFTYTAGYLIAYGISQNSFEADPNNKRLIAISNLQQGIIPSNSTFSIERTISCEDEPIKVVGLYYNRIAYFTSLIFKVLEIKNIIAIDTDEIFRGLNMGLPNANAVVEAKVKNEFGGIYWATPNDDVYRFIDGKPEFLMKGRILDEWLALGAKTSVQVAYHQEEKDVIFYLTKDLIYVYNILYNNWRTYKFPAEVNLCSTSMNGYLLAFTEADIIKKTIHTTETKDLRYAVSSGVQSVTNGTFETGSLSGWTATIDNIEDTPCGTISAVYTAGYGSSWGCKFLRAISGQGVMKLAQTINVSASSHYTFAYQQKNITQLNNGVLVYIKDVVNNKYLNAGGGSWASSKVYCFSGTYADWTLLTVAFYTLTGCTSLEISFEETAANLENNEQVIDEVSLIKTTITQYGIDIDLTKWVNNGSNTIYKLFNRIEAISDVLFDWVFSAAKITYSIYDSDSVLIDSEDYNSAALNKKINCGTAKRISDTSFKIVITSGTSVGITQFKLYEFVFNALLRRRGLTQ